MHNQLQLKICAFKTTLQLIFVVQVQQNHFIYLVFVIEISYFVLFSIRDHEYAAIFTVGPLISKMAILASKNCIFFGPVFDRIFCRYKRYCNYPFLYVQSSLRYG